MYVPRGRGDLVGARAGGAPRPPPAPACAPRRLVRGSVRVPASHARGPPAHGAGGGRILLEDQIFSYIQ
eukprot:scaffold921_cov397-Prasinococcus_capsulatus_cf.AAC.11